MNKNKLLIMTSFIFLSMLIRVEAQAEIESVDVSKKDGLKIVVKSLDINDEALKLVYEIRNDSEEDVWILADICSFDWHINRLGMHVDVFMDEDDETLVIRGRWCLPLTIHIDPSVYGRYVRLRAGGKQTETIFLKIPVHCSSLTMNPRFLRLIKRQAQIEQHPGYATRLVVELGYYTGDFPEDIIKAVKPPKKPLAELTTDDYRRWKRRYSHLPYTFSRLNERLTSREDEALVPELYAFTQITKKESEQVLRTAIERLRIPVKDSYFSYIEKEYGARGKESPDFDSCKKIEVRYQPSMLEYFFPFDFQKGLLSSEEKKYFKSEHTIVFEDSQDIWTILRDIHKERFFNSVVSERYRSYLDMKCYFDGKPPISFPVYNDDTVVYKGERLSLGDDFGEALKKLTPQINGIELRIRCAANLKNQWHRFLFYNMHEAYRKSNPSIRNKTIYPDVTKWCDAMLRSFAAGNAGVGKWPKRYHDCPSAGEGENHYAMNPNCKPDSPSDMVLLFETKAGWNQHGGPELFTLDNHDPKGGCVLLNDGTVKFIRTKQELLQLRWE